MGVKQTGVAEFKVANLVRNRRLLPAVQRCANQLMQINSPNVEQLIHRWLDQKIEYSNA